MISPSAKHMRYLMLEYFLFFYYKHIYYVVSIPKIKNIYLGYTRINIKQIIQTEFCKQKDVPYIIWIQSLILPTSWYHIQNTHDKHAGLCLSRLFSVG